MSINLRERAIAITQHLNTFNIEAIRGLLSDSSDFHFRFGPESALQALGKPGGFNKEEVLEFFGNHRKIVKHFNFLEPDFVVEGDGCVAYHTRSDGVSVDDQPFRNEYSWFVKFDDDGRILQVIEMVDSAYISQVVPRVGYVSKYLE
ncbi:nuclear transport factor 2 family protein [Aspergillus homomorphus CBS 101889]|uniref:SnoaL-like domain-containing protein n=1 Tax=Aspergillus homomorphus (strain CBS 101889) TaxID=1450537 RepID=A0A395HWF4_ASPHC|nr:hypothetical protein BO97DRAFT_425145 [Aspergillus homomorphus CBS 101889]RAL11846.1 hypothetical protein BO97DRAFT_425145 [Aspergillus homomorphus CBS 101889]